MGVGNVLDVPAVLEGKMQDHHATSVYNEADLPPEGAIKTLVEVRKNPHEEISGEGDVVDGLERRT